MITTAISSALIMYALAGVISLLVAALIRFLFVIVRRLGGDQ